MRRLDHLSYMRLENKRIPVMDATRCRGAWWTPQTARHRLVMLKSITHKYAAMVQKVKRLVSLGHRVGLKQSQFFRQLCERSGP